MVINIHQEIASMMKSVGIAGNAGHKILLQQIYSGALDGLSVFSHDATAGQL